MPNPDGSITRLHKSTSGGGSPANELNANDKSNTETMSIRHNSHLDMEIEDTKPPFVLSDYSQGELSIQQLYLPFYAPLHSRDQDRS